MDKFQGGFTGKIIDIDLSSGKIEKKGTARRSLGMLVGSG